MYIPIILGTARDGRRSEKAAQFIFEEVKKSGLQTEILDVRDFVKAGVTDDTETSAEAKKFGEKIEAADGLIIVSPEYNHGYPGELKIMLDTIEDQYSRKPVGICGVSSGGFGGVRMVNQLQQVLIDLGLVPIKTTLYFREVKKLFNEVGEIQDQSYYERVSKFLNELMWYAEALRSAREKTKH